ncbi:nuclear RNA polymerase D1B [Euphorbia peplus]|nr:nuclear RNA polymerase D1B [Euphorbia peplus]
MSHSAFITVTIIALSSNLLPMNGLPRCITFFCQDDYEVEASVNLFADVICPVLLETIIKCDPRVLSANVIRVSPDTTTWIRNPSRNQKAELALDVVIEKNVVKQSGDAWRMALDACLLVLHLIDTTRSIPYVYPYPMLLNKSKNLWECLAHSIKQLSEDGGKWPLSCSLDIQVPFTEATLFTHRRCFERAAEKCHVDSLSSVVASCSWGKHVADGTGSWFDLLWDHKEVLISNKLKRCVVYLDHAGATLYTELQMEAEILV